MPSIPLSRASGLAPEQIDPTTVQSEVVTCGQATLLFFNADQLLGDADGNGEVDSADFLNYQQLRQSGRRLGRR